MITRVLIAGFAILSLGWAGFADAGQDKTEKKRRTGRVTGELKSRKAAPNKINVLVEILADGEERARTYRVAYDPKVKGPRPEVLKAVKEAPLGSRVQVDWVDRADFEDGWRYELINGVLIVSPIPSETEADPNQELGYLLRRYQDDHPRGSALDKTLPGRTVKLGKTDGAPTG